jgi:dsDNA-specific endonuclease/ATPase MutS2
MKKRLLIPVFVASCCAALGVHSEERFDHYKGKPADTLEQAVANFSSHNEMLAEILARKDLDIEALVAIHEITYTLENALEKINAELEELAEVLEELHVASETANFEGTREHGKAYLDTARKVIP